MEGNFQLEHVSYQRFKFLSENVLCIKILKFRYFGQFEHESFLALNSKVCQDNNQVKTIKNKDKAISAKLIELNLKV